MIRHLTSLALGCAALAMSAPAQAGTDKETPGAPCTPGGGQGTGNPCKGNNGNPSPEGNAHKEKVTRDYNPPRFTIVRGAGSGAFIDQVGDANQATISQKSAAQYARIDQSGDGNTGTATQSGTGAHYAKVDQEGDDNTATVAQSGAGAQVAYLTQQGLDNTMSVTQNGGLATSGAIAMQMGDRNALSLTQNGENNMARLVQNGSDNAMTAVQNGNNQLTWTQTGSGLSDLQITQPAGQALLVTQTR